MVMVALGGDMMGAGGGRKVVGLSLVGGGGRWNGRRGEMILAMMRGKGREMTSGRRWKRTSVRGGPPRRINSTTMTIQFQKAWRAQVTGEFITSMVKSRERCLSRR